MVKKTVSKAEFAKLAGVTPAAVTKAVLYKLAGAMVGNRIDIGHESAIDYISKKARANPKSGGDGVDILYDEALEKCEAAGNWSASFIQRELEVSYARASDLRDALKNQELKPELAPEPIKAEPVKKKEAARVISGSEAARITKKDEAIERAAEELENEEVTKGSTLHEVPVNIESFADMTLRELIQRFGTDSAFVDWLKATQIIEAINEKRLKNAQTQGNLVSRELVKIGVIEPLDAVHIKLLTDGSKTITRRVTAMHDSGRGLDEIEAFVKDQITSFIRPVKAKVARALKNA
tara:strand:- start:42409 stop:43290 length:882 start_codon:yes stop_codon:yes gene_type:complete